MNEPLLIFDGDCSFCTSSAQLIHRWSSGRIVIQPWQRLPERMAALGLTEDDGMRQAWLQRPDGALFGGGAAVNEAVRFIWWARPFNWFYTLPGGARLVELAYRWVANNRYRLPGGTPACALPAPTVGSEQE